MPPRGDPRALALGPGYLYVNPLLDADEPVNLTDDWADVDPGWILLGYTETGSEFNYALTSGNVEVAEELDPVLISTTGRTSTVTFTMAEMTASNLALAMNGGVIIIAENTPGTDPDIVIVEPPDIGSEVRVMIGFESEDHTERWVMRQCFQTGTMKIVRAKGTTIAGIAVVFSLEKPATAKRLFAAIFDRMIRGGWSPQIPPAVPPPPAITSLSVTTGVQAGGYPTVLTGMYLRGATAVDFGTVPATGLTPQPGQEDTRLQVSVPAGLAIGPVDVTVTTPDGTSAPLVGGFTYTALTAATAVRPAAASAAGAAADPGALPGARVTPGPASAAGQATGPDTQTTP